MIRPERIYNEFLGLVGFRQSFDPAYSNVDSDNQTSESGLFYQDASSFVTIKNIIDCQYYSGIDDDDFNETLERYQNDAAIKVCQKVAAGQSKLLQDANLYPYEKSLKNTIEPNDKFVAFKIEPNTFNNSITSKVKWLEICLDSDLTFNVHLYNSNKPTAPISTKEISAKAYESVILNINDWFVADNESYKSGYFYIGYFESDLGTAKAIKKDYELSDNKVYSKYFYVAPVSLDYSGTSIDVTSYQESSDTFGLNIGISVYRDYTEIFCSNKSLFAQAIQYQMAEKVLNEIRTSTRSNITQRINKENLNQIGFELYGNREAGIEGVDGKLKQEIDNLKKFFFYKPRVKSTTLNYGDSYSKKHIVRGR